MLRVQPAFAFGGKGRVEGRLVMEALSGSAAEAASGDVNHNSSNINHNSISSAATAVDVQPPSQEQLVQEFPPPPPHSATVSSHLLSSLLGPAASFEDACDVIRPRVEDHKRVTEGGKHGIYRRHDIDANADDSSAQLRQEPDGGEERAGGYPRFDDLSAIVKSALASRVSVPDSLEELKSSLKDVLRHFASLAPSSGSQSSNTEALSDLGSSLGSMHSACNDVRVVQAVARINERLRKRKRRMEDRVNVLRETMDQVRDIIDRDGG